MGESMAESTKRIIGKDINDWHVIERDATNTTKNAYYWCVCKCGRKQSVQGMQLIKNRSRRCRDCVGRANCRDNNYNWKGFGGLSGTYWNQIRFSAKIRKLEFAITKEYVWNLFLKQNGKCAISGIDIILSTYRYDNPTASLDRIDSTIGYIPSNIQWIHKDINRMKSNFSDEYFISICIKIAKANESSKV
jgi:hypothetical protein